MRRVLEPLQDTAGRACMRTDKVSLMPECFGAIPHECRESKQ